MDSVDVNDTCKRPISLRKHHIWFSQPICFATSNGVANHSLRSPGIDHVAKDWHRLVDKLAILFNVDVHFFVQRKVCFFTGANILLVGL